MGYSHTADPAVAAVGYPHIIVILMNIVADNGLVTLPTTQSVDHTVDRTIQILREKNVALFAIIDHSGEAAEVGIKMRATKLVIFGNPKAGTPVMLSAPSSAIDLPLKFLIWEDANGKVWVTYNSPAYLRQRHNIPSDLLANIAVIDALAKAVVQ
jgi:uncharacterized protein (DUF302 family)